MESERKEIKIEEQPGDKLNIERYYRGLIDSDYKSYLNSY